MPFDVSIKILLVSPSPAQFHPGYPPQPPKMPSFIDNQNLRIPNAENKGQTYTTICLRPSSAFRRNFRVLRVTGSVIMSCRKKIDYFVESRRLAGVLLSVGCVMFQLLHCGGCRGCDCVGGLPGWWQGCSPMHVVSPVRNGTTLLGLGFGLLGTSPGILAGVCSGDLSRGLVFMVSDHSWVLFGRLPRSLILTRPLRESNLETPLGNHLLRYRHIRGGYALGID